MRATFLRSAAAGALCVGVMTGTPSAAWAQPPPPPQCTPAWSRVPSPSPGTIYSVLLDVAAVGAGDAWAVGFRAYTDTAGQYAVSPIIERWDGASWAVAYQPDSLGQLAGVIALASDDVYAVGHTGLDTPDYQPLIMHWDGAGWHKVHGPSAPMGYLTAIGGTGPDDLWAAGTLIGTYDTIIEHWDGDTWELVPHPSPSADYVALGGVAAVSTDDVTIVGTYVDGATHASPLALHWNGTGWRRSHPASVGDLGTSLNDVSVTPDGHVWAVGSAVVDGSGTTQAVAERLTRHGWRSTALPPLDGSAALASVTAGADGVWAVGTRAVAGGRMAGLTERWRPGAHEWRVVRNPQARGDNNLLAVDASADGEMWAVGFHRTEAELTLTQHRCA